MNRHETSAGHAAPGGKAFATVAHEHRTQLDALREATRQRRLVKVAFGLAVVLAYCLKRALELDPITPGLPTLGPDAWIYAAPIIIVIAVILTMAMPLASGRSPHVRFSPDQIPLTFGDVRGIDVALEEVTRTLQIFLTYQTFRDELGGNPRRGILFEGRPGTGKTHLAKAMAAEAGVPFFFASAPSFESMFFGMSAYKIRSFFKALRKAARKEGGAIGFIEEIDAIGGARSGVAPSAFAGMTSDRMVSQGGNGGFVNELLVQLQSFDTPPFGTRVRNRLVDGVNLMLPSGRQLRRKPAPYSNVLIIGATNRADTLDPALLRPGRFDRTLYFDLPSRAGRRDLLDYFLARRAHAHDLDREDLREEFASMTLGYTPAMIEHVLDEALVWAMRDGRRELNWRDVQRARLSEEIGLAAPVAYTERERALIATHEGGHAVAAYLCASQRKLEVLSIIKRRQALGLLAHSDTEERFTRSRSELEATLKIALAGMAAEELFFGESGTGPSSDLTAATTLAAQMVGAFGMGQSLVSYDAVETGSHGSPNLVAKVLSNDDTRREVDEILTRHKDRVAYLLEQNRDLVESLRDALLEHEELLGDEILAVIEQAKQRRSPRP
ncbi:MAG TPA: AAA family ATPase [Actinomycetota bacterium]|nr:AAA family ATPase [Actinomycetota bacterium]